MPAHLLRPEDNGSDLGVKEDSINSIELKCKPIQKKPTQLDKPHAFEDKRDDDPAYRNQYAVLGSIKDKAPNVTEEVTSF